MRFFFITIIVVFTSICTTFAASEQFDNMVITKVISSTTCFVQKTDQPFAAKLFDYTGPNLVQGQQLSFTGFREDVGLERKIRFTSLLSTTSGTIPKSVGTNNKTLYWALNGKGAPMFGLRITLWGQVIEKPLDYPYQICITDGSGIPFSVELDKTYPIRITVPDQDKFVLGQMVSCTGVLILETVPIDNGKQYNIPIILSDEVSPII